MGSRNDIPVSLMGIWRMTRVRRAILRQRLRERVEEFWGAFPRRRRRIMPVIVYGKDSTWFEPDPVPGFDPPDRLGLVVRWRVSGVYATKEEGGSKLHAMWEWEYPKSADPPTVSQLQAGHIRDPAAMENYRYLWRQIHALYDEYVFTSGWFDGVVRQVNVAERRLAEHPDGDEIRRRMDLWAQNDAMACQQ